LIRERGETGVRFTRRRGVAEIFEHNRHAELVSASIVQSRPKGKEAKWTLKQVQGDGVGYWRCCYSPKLLSRLRGSNFCQFVIARSEVTKQSRANANNTGLLRYARNDECGFIPLYAFVPCSPTASATLCTSLENCGFRAKLPRTGKCCYTPHGGRDIEGALP
jgi:hypothetical protein